MGFPALRVCIYLKPDVLDKELRTEQVTELEKVIRDEIYNTYQNEQPFTLFRYLRTTNKG
jgi:hypothetical protein